MTITAPFLQIKRMLPNFQGWTIVVAGQWNIRIFTPGWVAKNAFESNVIQTEIGFGALAPGAPDPVSLRYTSKGVLLVPLFDRLIVGVESETDNLLQQAESVALRIVRKLPHTPISAFGVNFSFVEKEPDSGALGLFNLVDLRLIPYEILQTEITRTLKLENGVLNLKQAFDQKVLRIDFNFHNDTPKGAEQIEAVMPGFVPKSRTIALNLLKAVYGVDLDREEGNARAN